MPLARGVLLSIAALVLPAWLGQSPQTPPKPAPASAAITAATLVGQVIDADTGEPIAEATVTMTGRPAPPRPKAAPSGSVMDYMLAIGDDEETERVSSGGNGRFVFRAMPVAEYSLHVMAPGYVDPVRPDGQGSWAQVEIKEGQTLANVTLRLVKQAVITGVVVDEASEPIIGAQVNAYRREGARLGGGEWGESGSATTDDRGMYRLSGLTPGEYIVFIPQKYDTGPAAGADALFRTFMSGEIPDGGLGSTDAIALMPNAVRIGEWQLSAENVQPPAAPDGTLLAYRTLYFPAAQSPADAQRISLRSGEERDGANFTLQPVVAGRVTGVVTGPSGPAGSMPVRLVTAGGNRLTDPSPRDVASGETSADGRFTLLGIPPGQYRLIARREAPDDMSEMPDELKSNPLMQMMMNTRGAKQKPALGQASVTVGPGEAAEVAVSVSEAVKVSGRLEFEGQPPATERVAGLYLRLLDDAVHGSADVKSAPDGTFAADHVMPGRYVLSASVAADGAWVTKRVTVGSVDVTRSGIVVDAVALTDIVVTLTREVGSLRGKVTTGAPVSQRAGRPGPPVALTAVVVPANYAEWTEYELLRDRVRFTSVEDGAFEVEMLLPGEYLVVVADESQIRTGAGFETLRALAAQATRVTVVPGDRNTVTVGVAKGR